MAVSPLPPNPYETENAAESEVLSASAEEVGPPVPESLRPPPAPPPAVSGPASGRAHREIDLLPPSVLMRIALADPAVSNPAPPARGLEFAAAPQEVAERNRRELLGPLYSTLGSPSGMTLEGEIETASALAALPAALLGSAVRPAVNIGYAMIDRIPAAVRRPFEKDFGLLIDTALSAAGALAMPVAASSVRRFFPHGAGLPASVDLNVPGYSQITNSCGETAAATILKASGEPVSLGGVDTQISGAGGSNLLMEAEFRRRGLTMINGPGDLTQLKAFLASGYPVMVSVGWAQGGGHYAVVTGYDEATKQLTIRNYDGHGGTNKVPYDDFSADWARHKNYMTAVVPKRDPRLEPLLKAGDPRRPAQVYPGLTLSDFWVTEKGKVFVEGAYRYVSPKTDVTVRLSYDSSPKELDRRLGGAFAIRQRVGPGWYLGLQIEKMSLKGEDENWRSFRTAPLSVYGSVEGPGFELRAGGERGAFQAGLAVDLGRRLSGLGLRANASVNPDGTYSVTGFLSATF